MYILHIVIRATAQLVIRITAEVTTTRQVTIISQLPVVEQVTQMQILNINQCNVARQILVAVEKPQLFQLQGEQEVQTEPLQPKQVILQQQIIVGLT